MKNQNMGKLNDKKYRFSLLAVTSLNLVLVVFLLNISFGQISGDNAQNQPPLKVEVVTQNDSPLRITLINVDNSSLSFQTVNFAVQNIGSKPIRAYTIFGKTETSGKILTNSLVTKLLQTADFLQNGLSFERDVIKDGVALFLSVDYVEFEDGSSWGEDYQGQSELIAGERVGRLAAIELMQTFVKNNDIAALTNLLEQQIAEIAVPLPADLNQSDKWRRGYQRGYKAVISVLQREKDKGINLLATKLDNMANLAKEVQKQ